MEKNWMPDIYSDVPVAYAVYKLIFAEDGRTVEDAASMRQRLGTGSTS